MIKQIKLNTQTMKTINKKMTESRLKEIVRKTVKRIVGKEHTPRQCCGFVNSDDCESLTYDYLINRNKDLPSEYFVPSDIPYDPNEIAMYTTPMDFDSHHQIDEGLIKTYPTKKTIEYICNILTKRGYPITPVAFKIDSPNDDGTIYGHIRLMVNLNYLNKEIDDILKQNFNTCGYHLGTTFNRVDDNSQQCVVYQFEPKFQTNVTNSNNGQYLYHVTTANSARKILARGFSPSNKNKGGFKYDGRCYFFNVFSKPLFSSYMQQAKKQNKINQNTFNNDFKIITIDRHKCIDATFFTDPNFKGKIAVFTYANIPPSAIVKFEDL